LQRLERPARPHRFPDPPGRTRRRSSVRVQGSAIFQHLSRAFFTPLLAGANFRDRSVACLGALLGIAGTASVCLAFAPAGSALPILVAPMGASAVLLFAVPASPLAQPWPILGGNVLSALVGIGVAHLVPNWPLAAGIAVAAAILLMSLLRCLHPPGGAAALLAVLGGSSVRDAGYAFALLPVGINALLLILLGILFHRVSGHSYPHRPVPVAGLSVAVPVDPRFRPEDIDAALAELGETFDVSREDLNLLFRVAERHASERRG
jgi:CBS domain-containing membrane protein